MKPGFFAGILAVGLGGCATAHRPPSSVAVSATTQPAPRAVSVIVLPAAPEPVYRNPKIGVVYLRAHQDTEGRLLGPQVMYQVTDPGGWNIEAVEQGKGYIPAVNLEVPPNLGSPYVVPASEAPQLPANAPLLDPVKSAQIVLTGLMGRDDQAQAESMARQLGEGQIALFDAEAGWVLMPAPSAPAR